MAGVHQPTARTGTIRTAHVWSSTARIRHAFLGFIRRVTNRCYADASCDASAQVSFYFALSLFPFLLVIAALVGWLPSTDRWIAFAKWLTAYLPLRTQHTMLTIMLDLSQDYRGFLSFGLVLTLWSASTGFVSLMSALSQAYGVRDERRYVKRRLLGMGVTVLAALFLVIWFAIWNAGHLLVAAITTNVNYMVFFSAQWLITRAIATLAVLWIGVDLLTYILPSPPRKWRWITPGRLFTVLCISLTSAGLNFYLSHAGSFSRLYGTLTGFIVVMFWIYIANLSLLVGAEADRVLAESKTAKAGA